MPLFDAADVPEDPDADAEFVNPLSEALQRSLASRYTTPSTRAALTRSPVGDNVKRLMTQAAGLDRITHNIAAMYGPERFARNFAAASGFQRIAEAHRMAVAASFAPFVSKQLPLQRVLSTLRSPAYTALMASTRRALAGGGVGLVMSPNVLAASAALSSLAAIARPRLPVTSSLLASFIELSTPPWARLVYLPAFRGLLDAAARNTAVHPDAGVVDDDDVAAIAADLDTCGFTSAFHRACAAAQANPATCAALLTDLVVTALMTALSWAAVADPALLNDVTMLVSVLLVAFHLVTFVMDRD